MVKKIVKNIIEYILVFTILTLLCLYINKGIVIKLLYMDDLLDWSWFRGLSLYEFAFKFYGSTKYRPIFEAIQYLLYTIIDTDPTRIVLFNEIRGLLTWVDTLSDTGWLQLWLECLWLFPAYFLPDLDRE